MDGKKTILLVEDDKIDVQAVERSFKQLNITNPLEVRGNGEEALEYIKNDDRPCLILLDLNMPKMGGIEFLEIVKADNDYKNIPVVVFTSSKEERDKVNSFNLGVAGYIVKPPDYKKFVEVVKQIQMYWTLSESP